MNRTQAMRAALAAWGIGFFLLGCSSYPFIPGRATVVGGVTSGADPGGLLGGSLVEPFEEFLLQERTFIGGNAVTTLTYRAGDLSRTPIGVDFNGDGKIDPVSGYGDTQAVVQILLSEGGPGDVDFLSLTLDSKRDMRQLADVAVGDIDGDGALDIVGAAQEGVWYFHHPSGAPPTNLRDWGNLDPLDDLRERIDTSVPDPNQNIQAIITQAIGPGVNIDDYLVTVEQLYTNVEVGDFDNDGDHDIAASRKFKVTLTPRPDRPVPPLEIVDGDVLVFENPGFAIDGHGWEKISVGRHERQQRLDRDGAAGLLLSDLDADGDLDIVSASQDDNNVQVAWFENPGPPLSEDTPWTQWRVGSVRNATGVTLADLTGDGRPDVVATGGEQMQCLLFEQPPEGPKREYDWDTHTIVTFENFQPIDVKALDIDNDGAMELVVGGTEGTVRYFESPADPRGTWEGAIVLDFELGGNVGLLGYGDLDADGDIDLVAIVSGEEENQSRLVWIRNN